MAKQKLARQELHKKLQAANNEVTEMYRKLVSIKQKKKSPTKKERDQAWKAIKDRQAILKQLEFRDAV